MNSDSCFYIGKDHKINEDYALASSSPIITYAIVSDGCSASTDVNFGAMCLAMSAKREIRLNPGVLAFDGKKAVANAQRVMDIFPYLSPQFLDATLLVACVNNATKDVSVTMYGDGVMVHRKKDGIVAAHIQLSSGAPDYLSYHLDPLRKQSYENVENNEKIITIFKDGKLDTSRTGDFAPLDPFIYVSVMEEGDIISVISDGINSFRKSNNDSIEWTDLIDEFTGYKNFEGEFVQRRIAAFNRKCAKEGITHSDDISVASIVI